MSRRARRQRPATEAEQAQFRGFAQLAEAAITAADGLRADKVARMRRAADRILNPGNLSNLSAAELVEHFAQTRDQPPTRRVGIHQKDHYGVAPGIDSDA